MSHFIDFECCVIRCVVHGPHKSRVFFHPHTPFGMVGAPQQLGRFGDTAVAPSYVGGIAHYSVFF